jgi:breast cancer 2 susceptibility protein
MVLCVSQIRWDEVLDDSAPAPPPGEAPLAIVGLELTDGWYRIRTNVDATLKSACERGKIVVGSKIAIMGAKVRFPLPLDLCIRADDLFEARLLEVGRQGPSLGSQQFLRSFLFSLLLSFHCSYISLPQLIISGNSTSLVPWHARLGFHDPRHRFINSLDRLTSQGGVVSLIDVGIERAYPCGFIDLRKGRGTETWGEEEELARQEEWKVRFFLSFRPSLYRA